MLSNVLLLLLLLLLLLSFCSSWKDSVKPSILFSFLYYFLGFYLFRLIIYWYCPASLYYYHATKLSKTAIINILFVKKSWEVDKHCVLLHRKLDLGLFVSRISLYRKVLKFRTLYSLLYAYILLFYVAIKLHCGMTNSIDPNRTTSGAVWSASTLFAILGLYYGITYSCTMSALFLLAILLETLVYEILGMLPYLKASKTHLSEVRAHSSGRRWGSFCGTARNLIYDT